MLDVVLRHALCCFSGWINQLAVARKRVVFRATARLGALCARVSKFVSLPVIYLIPYCSTLNNYQHGLINHQLDERWVGCLYLSSEAAQCVLTLHSDALCSGSGFKHACVTLHSDSQCWIISLYYCSLHVCDIACLQIHFGPTPLFTH